MTRKDISSVIRAMQKALKRNDKEWLRVCNETSALNDTDRVWLVYYGK